MQVWAKERQEGCSKNFDENFASEKGHFWRESILEIHEFGLSSRSTSPYLCESMEIFVKIAFWRLHTPPF